MSWCSWLSRQSNTLKVSGSNPGDASLCFRFAIAYFPHLRPSALPSCEVHGPGDLLRFRFGPDMVQGHMSFFSISTHEFSEVLSPIVLSCLLALAVGSRQSARSTAVAGVRRWTCATHYVRASSTKDNSHRSTWRCVTTPPPTRAPAAIHGGLHKSATATKPSASSEHAPLTTPPGWRTLPTSAVGPPRLHQNKLKGRSPEEETW